MNERIKLLAEKADLCFIGHDGKLTSHFENFADMDKEVLKFAELIVKETMQVVANNLPQNQYVDVARAVIKHYE